ncbi:MAG TPA: hypothetical protein VEL74_08935 [Thermoanaerobaculia bacterium]|nr:hypothetical protein [Thermoanaerobaculia bacterium]
MSRRTVRRVTAAAVLALALLFAGPGTAAAGSLEVAVPAFQGSSLLDRFLDWLDGLWDDQAAASDKSILTTGSPNSGTNAGNPTGSTSTVGGNGLGEQGGMIDPDG